ncbi:protein DCL [Populus alba x Populus x berolinensis]|uniref:Protein DCL, chloroplastic n=3 Tax=Populus TaxID=3689 RepID=A0A4U5N982_POPAL|nr:protein DCL homolog, chloroplastic [Populus alba]KAJ6878764.1 protein DCL [Populus alba x Populus x berolinensis]KAJ6971700.1 protein DCL [Populus alba x Populus x berolinensis]TKR78822.1 protein DCL, chloroplastic [Populus alba]
MAMASLSKPPPSLSPPALSNPISLFSSPAVVLSFPFNRTAFASPRLFAIKTGSDGSDLLRKPIVPSEKDLVGISEEVEDSEEEKEEGFVDWEDRILEDTVPLVGFVRMILHSGKYESGDRLSPDHERTIVDRLLAYHPDCDSKIGCGIDYITVGYHPDFVESRCLFIVRKDGQLVDFSYWKCIKGLIKKNYPLYADSFILRHFRRRRRS